jgi:hypothetical protein
MEKSLAWDLFLLPKGLLCATVVLFAERPWAFILKPAASCITKYRPWSEEFCTSIIYKVIVIKLSLVC